MHNINVDSCTKKEMLKTLKKDFLCTDIDDFMTLLNLSSKIKKYRNDCEQNLRVAVIGTSSIQMIVSVLDAMLYCDGIECDFYEGEYNGIALDVFDENSVLYKFNPKIVVMLPDIYSISNYPQILDNDEQVKQFVEMETENYIKSFQTIHTVLPDANILCSNIPIGNKAPLGNMEANYMFSNSCFISWVNQELVRKKPNYVTYIDIHGLSEQIGSLEWYDPVSYYMSKQGFNLKYIGNYCNLIRKQVRALCGNVRKCLVLDLDNTIWGGAVGDVGFDGILLEPNDPEGEAFLAFQKYIIELKNRGVIIAVCSKNERDIAMEPFEKNPYMVLRKEDISCFVANWDDKVSNIRLIAQTLNIGTDSMVFFDDNPTERDLVRKYLPEVDVIEVPEDPAMYIRALDISRPFEWIQLTKEDLNRTKTYVDGQKREQLRLNYADYDDYLKGLDMVASFNVVNDKNMDRFVQLLNKTNQFNLMTNRYGEAQITEMRNNKDYGLYTVSLKDCFSNYGIIACLIVFFKENECHIMDWCMSCRVLKKGVENYILSQLIDICKERKVCKISGSYRRSKKNNMVSDLYNRLGFMEKNGNDDAYKSFYIEEVNYDMAKTFSFIREDSL